MPFELSQSNSAAVLAPTSLAPVLDKASLTPAMTGWGRASQALLFIDGSVADYQQLVAGASAGTEVHVLDSAQDAVTQITNTLLGRSGISSVQIVSHGEAGGLDFGSSRLNLTDLPGYAAQVQSWGQALTEEADILLYGCNVASGELGKAFVNILGQLTGADVAASDNLTGSAAFGGDWTLEFQTGQIESGFGFQAEMATYQGTLTASLVKAGRPGPSFGFSYSDFVVFNNTLYFETDSDPNGSELWKLDSSDMASLVRDINPGSAGSDPGGFTIFNNALYFSANDGSNGREVWKVDSSGAVSLVSDINPGSASSSPSRFTVFNNALYFAADDGTSSFNGTSSFKLWKVDTTGIASLVSNISLDGSSFFGNSNLGGFTIFNNALYLSSNDGTSGDELWKVDIDGVASLVRDINPGNEGSYLSNFTVFNNTLYFRAYTEANAGELWKVDSSGAASLVRDINPGRDSSTPKGFTIFNNALYFSATDGTNGRQVWKVDSSGAVSPVSNINLGYGGSDPNGFTLFNDALYFLAFSRTTGSELWKLDNNGAVSLVRDINPGSASSSPGSFTIFNNALYFVATDGTNSDEVWKVNNGGMVSLVRDINPGRASGLSRLTVFNNALYFSVNNGTSSNGLWKEDLNDSPILAPTAAVPVFTVLQSQQTSILSKSTQKLLLSQPPALQQLFDEAYYLRQNSDVYTAYARGVFQSGFQHFLQYGQYEGRNPSSLFNEQYYLSQNADVTAAVSRGNFRCGFQHFLSYGQYESRNSSSLYNEQSYLSRNQDVAAAVGRGSFRSGFQHLLKYGLTEGRLANVSLFNESYYLSQNPTVAAAIAQGGFQSGLQHFELYGQREGRRPSQLFDEFYYLNQNADVAVAVAKGSFKSGFQHYLDFGRFEGRSGIG